MKKRFFEVFSDVSSVIALLLAAVFTIGIVVYSYAAGETKGYSAAKKEFDNYLYENNDYIEQQLDLHAYFLDPIEVKGEIKYNVWDIESSCPILIEGSLSEIDSAIVADNL